MFFVLILTLWTGLHAYVFFRASSVPWLARRVPRRTLLWIALGCWSTWLVARALEALGAAVVAWPLELLGVTWLGILFLVTICLWVVELITLYGFVLRRHAALLRGIAIAAGGALSIVALVQGLRPPTVTDETVRLQNLPADADGLTVVALSDLHLGTLLGPSWLEARVEQVNELKPDLVLLLGDLVEGDRDAEEDRGLSTILRRLRAPLGVWAVLGNHDVYGGPDSVRKLLADGGAHVLDDEWAEVRPGLVLAGVADRGHDDVSDPADRVRKALSGRPPGAATILLSHRARNAEVAARDGAGLMLSGHTHGGQIWPFDYLSMVVNPLMEGRYDVEGMTVFVSRGAGTWGPRMRLWSPGEILRLTLRAP